MFTTAEVARLSGLSTGQIDQLISRWGVGLWMGSTRGSSRKFLAVDAFKFMIAGELHRLGIDQRTVRDMLASLLPDSQNLTEEPPTFPHQRQDGPRQFVVIFTHNQAFASIVVDGEALGRALAARKTAGAIVLDATAMAERIARAGGKA